MDLSVVILDGLYSIPTKSVSVYPIWRRVLFVQGFSLPVSPFLWDWFDADEEEEE